MTLWREAQRPCGIVTAPGGWRMHQPARVALAELWLPRVDRLVDAVMRKLAYSLCATRREAGGSSPEP